MNYEKQEFFCFIYTTELFVKSEIGCVICKHYWVDLEVLFTPDAKVLNATGLVIIILIAVELYVTHNMSQDFRGAISGAMHGAGGRRLDGDSLRYAVIKSA